MKSSASRRRRRSTTRTQPSKTLAPSKAVHVGLSEEVVAAMDNLVQLGWFPSRDFIIEKALKKFLHWNRPEDLQRAILEDVESALGKRPQK